jgi:hypothetical protein
MMTMGTLFFAFIFFAFILPVTAAMERWLKL